MKNPISEREYVRKCINQINDKYHIRSSDKLIQRDYEHLSLKIFEKSKIRISESTLRRIWNSEFKSIPQVNTLQALAIFNDYKSWYEFKDSLEVESIKKNKSNNFFDFFKKLSFNM